MLSTVSSRRPALSLRLSWLHAGSALSPLWRAELDNYRCEVYPCSMLGLRVWAPVVWFEGQVVFQLQFEDMLSSPQFAKLWCEDRVLTHQRFRGAPSHLLTVLSEPSRAA